jgi:hypothetical protein
MDVHRQSMLLFREVEMGLFGHILALRANDLYVEVLGECRAWKEAEIDTNTRFNNGLMRQTFRPV